MDRRFFGVLSIFLTVLVILLALAAFFQLDFAAAQSGLRLGSLDVNRYCTDRGYVAGLTNNNNDWACFDGNGNRVIVWGQAELDESCRLQYGRKDSIKAIKDGTNAIPAYNWSCYDTGIATSTIVAGSKRLGSIEVNRYCTDRGYKTDLINSDIGWACYNTGGAAVITWTQNELNESCRLQYGRKDTIIALRDGTNAVAAYNWSCYDTLPGATLVPVPTIRPYNQIGTDNVGRNYGNRLGGLSVNRFCVRQGYEAQVINNSEWACINPFTGFAAFSLNRADLDTICRENYHANAFAVLDGNNAITAYNWSCYEPYTRFGDNPNPLNQQLSVNGLGPVQGLLSARFGYEVNVRAEPSTESAKLGRINSNGSYPLIGADGNWYIIDYRGQRGYVAARWVVITR